MLWQKELQNGTQLDRELSQDIAESRTLKDSSLTAFLICEPNKKSRENENNEEKTLQEMNKQFCFAEIGTEEAGIAFCLRSTWYCLLEQYSLSLADVEQAKKNPLSTSTIKTLNEIRDKSFRLMIQNQANRNLVPSIDSPKLSFPADEKIPCFAQGLEVKYSKKYGNHIVTNTASHGKPIRFIRNAQIVLNAMRI